MEEVKQQQRFYIGWLIIAQKKSFQRESQPAEEEEWERLCEALDYLTFQLNTQEYIQVWNQRSCLDLTPRSSGASGALSDKLNTASCPVQCWWEKGIHKVSLKVSTWPPSWLAGVHRNGVISREIFSDSSWFTGEAPEQHTPLTLPYTFEESETHGQIRKEKSQKVKFKNS